MASLTQREGKSGKVLREITFTLGGKRQYLRLGKASKRAAETVRGYVERLVIAKTTGSVIDTEAARWLSEIDDKLHSKLSDKGLCEPRRPREEVTVRGFAASWIEAREKSGQFRPKTVEKYRKTEAYLADFFGDRTLESLTAADGDAWELFLLGKGLAKGSTVRKHNSVAKQIFRAAVRAELIRRSPFEHLNATDRPNESRSHFVSRDAAEAVIEECPNASWRLLVALSRYGGLRVPSETSQLKWSHINWANGSMVIPQVKTAERVCPIFRELEPYLREAFELAPEGDVYVLPARMRGDDKNLRTTLKRIILKAGLEVWPRPFHNMRASRQTELVEAFPGKLKTICKWLGNSERVAYAHYIQVDKDWSFLETHHFQHQTAAEDGKHAATRRVDEIGRALKNKGESLSDV